MYVGGGFTTYNGSASNRIIRLNSDGSIDTVFAMGNGFDGTVYSLSPATDGSGDVYVGGNFSSYNGTASSRIILLNSDGSVDTAFAVGSGFDNNVQSISPTNDGSGDVYVGGNFSSYNGTTSNRIIRLNSDGSVDTAFTSGFNSTVYSLSPTNDGSGNVYVGGAFTTYNGSGSGSTRIIRLNSDGSVDTAFAIGSGFNARVRSISPATDGSGDVYVGGSFTTYNGSASNRIIRLNSDGSVDTAFVVGSGFDNEVLSLSPAADGSGNVYAGGYFTTYNGTGSNYIIRLNSDSSVDAGFAVGSGFDNEVLSLSPATDGSGDVYVGGLFTTYNGSASNRIIRLNSDGSVDAGFAVGSGFDSDVQSLSTATDGSGDVYVGGSFTTYNGSASNRIIRLNSDGTVDTAFAVGSGFGAFDEIKSLSPTTDGSGDVYVGGGFTTYNGTNSNRIIRLNSDGTVDTAFAVGDGFNNDVHSLSLATDGSGDVYVGGIFTTYNVTGSNYIIRLNSDGSVDAGFTVGSGFDNNVQSISPATDGSGDVYVGGAFTTYNGTGSSRIIRLNSDGSVDSAFAVGNGFNSTVFSLSPATDGSGDVYVGGNFITYNGTGSNRTIRLNSDGSVDTTFAMGDGFNGSVQSISSATDGSGDVFVGGSFSSYRTTTVDNIVRLNPDGSLN